MINKSKLPKGNYKNNVKIFTENNHKIVNKKIYGIVVNLQHGNIKLS